MQKARKNMRSKIIIGTIFFIILFGIIIIVKKDYSKDKKNVYAILPLTGQSSDMGKTAMATIDMFMKKYNRGSFNLSIYNSESNPSKAISVIRQAIVSKGMPEAIIVFPAYISSAVIPTITEKDIFVFAPTSRIPDNSKTREQNNYHYVISVDGGVNNETVKLAKKAGVDMVVSGSYVCGSDDYDKQIETLR